MKHRTIATLILLAACGPDAPPPASLAVASVPAAAAEAAPPEPPAAPVAVNTLMAEAAEPDDAACDPNYRPCVPIASDVDCAGGRGNGPAYVRGPVRVIRRDIYDLDRDGDRIGCDR